MTNGGALSRRALALAGILAMPVPCVAVLAAQETQMLPASTDLLGTWSSGNVRLVRANINETYSFVLVLHQGDDGMVRGAMEVTYGQTGAPTTRLRRIWQDLEAQFNGESDEWVLTGSNPRLVSGPAIVGVYEPDDLYCAIPEDHESARLHCRWGSSAHGTAPVVTLARIAR